MNLVSKGRKFIRSFKYAYQGFIYAFKTEFNLKVHIVVAFLLIILGFVLKITKTEILITLVLIGQVISLELVNTAIERTVDLACSSKNSLAKVAKDCAAASVLISAIMASIVGVFIYLPYIIKWVLK